MAPEEQAAQHDEPRVELEVEEREGGRFSFLLGAGDGGGR
jgi:hypothetical protein